MASRTKLPRLRSAGRIDIPVVEASGLAVRASGDELHLIAVGDRTAEIAIGSESTPDGVGAWAVVDLSTIDGWSLPSDDSQLEAVAADGGSLVALMREDPPVVLIADTTGGRVVATIGLRMPEVPADEVGWDDPSSRGEGLVLLRGGRLLVAKEKRSAALIEFCPAGEPSRGLSPDDFLDDGESWDPPSGEVEYLATAVWRLKGKAKQVLRDVSDLEVGRDRSLWMLSDQSATLGRLRLDDPLPAGGGAIKTLDDAWRLPKGVTKPEGVVAFGDGRALIAMDTRSPRANGVIVGPA